VGRGRDDEPVAVDVVGHRSTPDLATEGGEGAVVDEHLLQRRHEHLERAEVGVVAVLLAGEVGVDGVVDVVVPLSRHAQTTLRDRSDHGDVVEIRLRDEAQGATETLGELRRRPGELGEHVGGGVVAELVHGVETERVEVEVAEPPQRVVDDEGTDVLGAGLVEVDGGAPRGVVGLGEVGPEDGEVVAGGAEVVVDHVEADAQVAGVSGVDESLQGGGAAVGVVDGVEIDAVVTPATVPGEGRHRHQLDDVDAELGEVVEPLDRGVEGALGGEGADVELVDEGTVHLDARPVGVMPCMRGRVEGARGPVHTVRLVRAAGIRVGSFAVDDERVVGAGRKAGGVLPPAVDGGQRGGGVIDGDLDGRCAGRPDADRESAHRARRYPLGRRPNAWIRR
jgi:hypothetical protein